MPHRNSEVLQSLKEIQKLHQKVDGKLHQLCSCRYDRVQFVVLGQNAAELSFIFNLCNTYKQTFLLNQRWHVWWSRVNIKHRGKPIYKLFWHWHVHFHSLGHQKSLHHIRRLSIACLSCLFCECSAPPCRRADSTQLRNLTRQRKKRERERGARMNVWQLPVLSPIDCDERKEYIYLIYWWEIWDSWAARFMAASFRNSVWVAPEQDAQLQTTAPLTDHGQVFCHTTHAIAPIPSDYHLVSFDFCLFVCF